MAQDDVYIKIPKTAGGETEQASLWYEATEQGADSITSIY